MSLGRRSLCLLLTLACAACGGGQSDSERGGAPVVGGGDETAGADLGFPAVATKNTTRVASRSPVETAAAVALATYPSTTRETRPRAVALVDISDWRTAISAAQLASEPVGAPLLYARGSELPDASADALEQLEPTGVREAGAVQLIRVGTPARPSGYDDTNLEGAGAAALARAIDAFHSAARGKPTSSVLVAPADAPAHAMPAAAWAAKSGDPVLWTNRDDLPPDTRAAIVAHGRPSIYVLGPESAVSKAVVDRLERLGSSVRRIGAVEDVAAASVAFARFSDGSFGWNVTDPGHGLVFAAVARPGDAGAAASLSTAGTYGPLLVLPDATTLAPALRGYLLDIQPGYESDPVRGVYNHAWLIGDESAVSVAVQSRIDALLEIQPVDTTP